MYVVENHYKGNKFSNYNKHAAGEEKGKFNFPTRVAPRFTSNIFTLTLFNLARGKRFTLRMCDVKSYCWYFSVKLRGGKGGERRSDVTCLWERMIHRMIRARILFLASSNEWTKRSVNGIRLKRFEERQRKSAKKIFTRNSICSGN